MSDLELWEIICCFLLFSFILLFLLLHLLSLQCLDLELFRNDSGFLFFCHHLYFLFLFLFHVFIPLKLLKQIWLPKCLVKKELVIRPIWSDNYCPMPLIFRKKILLQLFFAVNAIITNISVIIFVVIWTVIIVIIKHFSKNHGMGYRQNIRLAS